MIAGFCYDYRGYRVMAGQSYYDGCNTCTCGYYGEPTACTYRACGGTGIGGGHWGGIGSIGSIGSRGGRRSSIGGY